MTRYDSNKITRLSRVAIRERSNCLGALQIAKTIRGQIDSLEQMELEKNNQVCELVKQINKYTEPSSGGCGMSATEMLKNVHFMHTCVVDKRMLDQDVAALRSVKIKRTEELEHVTDGISRHWYRESLCLARVALGKAVRRAEVDSLDSLESEEWSTFEFCTRLLLLVTLLGLSLPEPCLAADFVTDPWSGAQLTRTILSLLFVCGLAFVSLVLLGRKFEAKRSLTERKSHEVAICERIAIDGQTELLRVLWSGVGEFLLSHSSQGMQVLAFREEGGKVSLAGQGFADDHCVIAVVEDLPEFKSSKSSDVH